MNFLIQLPVLLFSVIFHEYAHGWMAEKRGDDTARLMGRLTFNPIPHIDLFGTILLPGLALLIGAPVFGWAKPVPINPYRLNDPVRDMVWVSFAGPASNMLLALAAAFVMWVLRFYGLLGSFTISSVYLICMMLLQINIVLLVLNLVPVPPLDGSRIVAGLLPRDLAFRYSQLEPYGFFIILLLLSSGILWRFMGPIINFLVYTLSPAVQ